MTEAELAEVQGLIKTLTRERDHAGLTSPKADPLYILDASALRAGYWPHDGEVLENVSLESLVEDLQKR